MKITCPMCAQEGSAPDHVNGKKVRCPGCEKVFRVHKEFITNTLPEGVVVCSRCQFAFSEMFTDTQEGKTLCKVCVNLSPA